MDEKVQLIDKARAFVKDIIKAKLPASYLYHNFKHLKNVAKSVHVIGEGEGVTNDDLEIIGIAAWFHDIGYVGKL